MTSRNGKATGKIAHRFRCAIYTRKSTEDGLEQEFNSLDAQREAGESAPRKKAIERSLIGSRASLFEEGCARGGAWFHRC
ncbi:MAG: hypothetical protein QGG36_30895 [Pirellulaceae bacterium]|nr:hypothetical protein [Pirellulaceae bacterium]